MASTEENVATRLARLHDAADLDVVLELLDMYAREPMGQGRPLDDAVRRRLARDLPQLPHLFVVLAEADKRAVGIAVCFESYSTFLGQPLVNIHDLAVVPDARGRGVGRRLIDAVEAEARRRGCGRITLEVRSDNLGAQQLYRRLGFSSGEASWSTEFWTRPLHNSCSDTNDAS